MGHRMIKLALLFLLLTLPLLSGSSWLGVPLWVWGSLGMTLLFAAVIIMIIETRWESIKNEEPLDG